MTYCKLIAHELEEQDFDQVVAYGFVTEQGAEDELQTILDENDERDVSDYEIMDYHHEEEPKLYYDGETFSRTFSAAKYRS